jgi:DNA polymerase-3 subunit gamma/tau
VQEAKRSAWTVVYTSQARALTDDVLTVSFVSQNDVDAFKQGGPSGVSEVLRNAIIQVLGLRVKFIARAEGPAAAPVAEGAPAAAPFDGPEPVEPIRDEPEPPELVEPAPPPPAVVPAPKAQAATQSQAASAPAKPAAEPAPAKPAVDAQGWAVAEIPQDDAPTQKAASQKHVPKPKAEPVASTEPARYGESVVRELLGANFIEEQAIAPKVVPRPNEAE